VDRLKVNKNTERRVIYLKIFLKVFLSLLLILSLISGISTNSAKASTGIIDNYIKVKSISKKSNGKINIKYTLKNNFKTNLGFNVTQSLGFTQSMHSSLQIKYNFVPVKSKKGTYIAILSAPSPDFLGSQVVYAKWSSVITKSEAIAGKITMDYLPGIAITILVKGNSATIKSIAKKATGIASGLVGFNLATGYFKQMPAPSAGQVYYRESQIKTNGKIYHRLLIFANNATYKEFKISKYKKSKLAIYDNSTTTTLNY